jgi:parvulin-like peptidyl-prolyl isomerase
VRKFSCFLFLCSIALAFSACQSGPASKAESGKDEVATIVNGAKILVADVDRAVTQQLRGQERQLSPLELAAARLQAIDELITREVLYQRAQKENLNPTEDEITQLIQRNKQESGMTEEAFQKQLKETNQTEAQFRDDIRKQLAIQKLQDKMTAQLKVKDSEVEAYFTANPKQFVAQPGVAISDIIVDPADNGAKFDAKGDLAAEQKIKEIYTRLKNGADFATIARQLSEHESFQRSGDLGFLSQEQFGSLPQVMGLPAKLGEDLMKMEEGDIMGPIKDQAGRWHIFKLTGKRTETKELTLSDPEVRKQISDLILNQRKQLVNSALLTRARDEAKIENYLAQRMLENPNTFGVLRPVTPAASASATPQASPGVAASPAATASPAEKK